MTGWDTRAKSGLRPPRAISTNINPAHGVAGHYGGSGPFKRSDHDACRAIWRGWQDFHMSPDNSNNYNDIAYNLGVCHHDIILEGRSTRTRPIVRGGANGNFTVNTNRYSVVAIWGVNDGEWPDKLKRAWRTARDWLQEQDSRTGDGLTPHSAMSSTGCPGKYGRAFLAAGAPYPSSTGDDDMTPAEARMLKDLHDVLVNGNDSMLTTPSGKKVSVREGVRQTLKDTDALRDRRVRFYPEHWAVEAGLMSESTYLPTTALRNIWPHAKSANIKLDDVLALLRAQGEVLAEIVASDPNNALTRDDVRQLLDEAFARNVVKVEVSIQTAEDDDSAEQEAEADTDA